MATIFNDSYRESTAFINPADCVKQLTEFPEICITTFSQNITTEFIKNNGVKIITNLYTANGILSIYKVKYNNCVFLSKVGAPTSLWDLKKLLCRVKKQFSLEAVAYSTNQ